jgi:hypothetical protein
MGSGDQRYPRPGWLRVLRAVPGFLIGGVILWYVTNGLANLGTTLTNLDQVTGQTPSLGDIVLRSFGLYPLRQTLRDRPVPAIILTLLVLACFAGIVWLAILAQQDIQREAAVLASQSVQREIQRYFSSDPQEFLLFAGTGTSASSRYLTMVIAYLARRRLPPPLLDPTAGHAPRGLPDAVADDPALTLLTAQLPTLAYERWPWCGAVFGGH